MRPESNHCNSAPNSVLAFMIGFLFICPAIPACAQDNDRQLEFFETKIRPVLSKHCAECHSTDSKDVKGNLRLDSAAAMLRGGDSGAVLVKGNPEESLLIEALRYDGLEMPPEGRLPDHVGLRLPEPPLLGYH